jgi:hypothetical protein
MNQKNYEKDQNKKEPTKKTPNVLKGSISKNTMNFFLKK